MCFWYIFFKIQNIAKCNIIAQIIQIIPTLKVLPTKLTKGEYSAWFRRSLSLEKLPFGFLFNGSEGFTLHISLSAMSAQICFGTSRHWLMFLFDIYKMKIIKQATSKSCRFFYWKGICDKMRESGNRKL